MTGDPRCPLCQLEEESALHLFRDCSQVKPLWGQVVDHSCLPCFFQLGLKEWVTGFLHEDLRTAGSPVPLDFGFLLWAIWKARSEVVFNNGSFILRQIVETSMRYQSEFADCDHKSLSFMHRQPNLNHMQVQNVAWIPPPPLWYKCNVDGSVRQAT